MHTRIVRCFISRFLLVTVVAVEGPGVRGWAVEARLWGHGGAVAVVVDRQGVALRLARAAVRAESAPAGIAELLAHKASVVTPTAAHALVRGARC